MLFQEVKVVEQTGGIIEIAINRPRFPDLKSPSVLFNARLTRSREVEQALQTLVQFSDSQRSPFHVRVEDWRHCSVGSAYPLLPVSVGSASLTEP